MGGFRFEERGRVWLKGLDGTHRLYAVIWKQDGQVPELQLAATAE